MQDSSDDEREKQRKPEPEPVRPPIPEFQGSIDLLQRLLMAMAMARTPFDRHEYAIQFLTQASSVLHEDGAEEEAEEIWDFLKSYEAPRIRTMPVKSAEGRIVYELEAIGVSAKGKVSLVAPEHLGFLLDKMLNQLSTDSFVRELASLVSETQAILVRRGLLTKRPAEIDPFSGLVSDGA